MYRLRRHRRLALFTPLLVLVAWLGGSVFADWHESSVLHVVCDEHGQVVEVRSKADLPDHPAGKHDGGTAQHKHGCAFDVLANPPVDTPALTALPALRWVDLPADEAQLASLISPRGPPLVYAPKTSPPLHA